MSESDRDSWAWWEAEALGKKPHDVLWPLIQQLLSDQSQRYENYRRLINIFEFGPKAEAAEMLDRNLSDNTVSVNWARRAVLTLKSKLTKTVSTPMPLTTGATWDDRDNAENLGKAIDGEFRRNKVEEIIEDVIEDGLTLGDGYFFVPFGQGKIEIKFLPAEDVLIDVAEGRYRQPRSIYVRVLIDRDELLARYGEDPPEPEDGEPGPRYWGTAYERRLKIRTAARETSLRATAAEKRSAENQVEVWMAFHLASGPDADDGRYAVVINGYTLEICDWNRERFPVAHYSPWKRRRGYHGLSMLAEILPLQREYDLCLTRFQLSNKRLGGTHLLVDRTANIDEQELNNGQGTRIYFEPSKMGGEPIKELHPTVANESAFTYAKGLVDSMMQLYAIPSMVMTGEPPAGLKDTSGKALELADEQAAEALINQHRAKEACLVDLAWLVIEEAEAICETKAGRKYTVNVHGKRGLEKVRWKDVLLAREEYELDVRPAGDLARAPAARFKQCLDMLDRNAISVEQFRSLWSMPDLEAANDLDLSDSEIIQKTMAAIVRHGKPLLPMAYDNLQLVIVLGRKFYNLCRVNEIEDDRLQLLDDYIQRAFDMEQAQKAAAAATQLPPAGPQGPVPGEPVPQQAA